MTRLLLAVLGLRRLVYSDFQRTLTYRYLKQRGVRAALVALSIALGVGVLVATQTLNQNLGRVAQDAVNPLAGDADLIVWNGQTGVPMELEDQIRGRPGLHVAQPVIVGVTGAAAPGATVRPGLRDVRPVIVGRAFIPELSNPNVAGMKNRSVTVLGVRLPRSLEQAKRSALPEDAKLTVTPLGTADHEAMFKEAFGLLLTQDVPVFGSAPVVVGKEIAASIQNERNGDRNLHVRMAGVERRVTAVGTFTVEKGGPTIDGHTVFMEISAASPLMYPTRKHFVSHFQLYLEPGVDAEKFGEELERDLGLPYRVQTKAINLGTIRDITAGLELGFAIGGAGALVIGLFLVYNALSVSVAERRHDIGILRAVGATRGQIAGLFMTEAALLGLVGSGLGIPLGYLLARIAAGPISKVLADTFAQVELPVTYPDWKIVVLAMAGGVGTTVVASLLPAFTAAMEEPANAVRRVPQRTVWLGRLLLLGAALLLIGGGLGCVLLREWLPLRFGPFAGMVLMLLGLLVATPVLSEGLGRLLQPFFRHFMGLEGRLAADNLTRSPTRTGLVIAALAATTGLMVQTAGFIESTEYGLLRWLDESIAADVFLTAGSGIDEPGGAMPSNESLAEKVRALPEVDSALPIRFHGLLFRERLVVMLAIDTDAFDNSQRHDMPLARNLDRFPRLKEGGTAVVSENFAALYHVKVGDRITIDGVDGTHDLEVIGTLLDYTWNRGTILVDRGWYREKYKDHQVDVIDVYLKPGVDREAARKKVMDNFNPKDAVFAVTRDRFRESIAKQLRQVYSLAYAQQAVVGMVALLGVISAVFISVLQRRRQLGLLRAVGASQWHVLRTVLAEAVLMGLIGAVLGLGIGVLLEWYLIDLLIFDESGFLFPIRIAWGPSAVVAGLAVALATLVGLWPAWQATRVRIAEAIAYE